jgi:asparagine synthase (glutamine-hydrolysing)
MCGIAGFITKDVLTDRPQILRDMITSISHRGPDGDGYYKQVRTKGGYQLGLGHCRLAIIDLSTGQQPMENENGKIKIIFNGEIYNFLKLRQKLIACGHIFKTKSDTETLLHAYEQYGLSFVDRLKGMFAFAIWDEDKQKLILGRDRFGEKPLYYHCRQDGSFIFASEIKALLVYPGIAPKCNLEGVWHYLAYRYVPGPDTLFDGIKKLPPATLAVWHKGQLNLRRYYEPPDKFKRYHKVGKKTAIDGFYGRLDTAVKSCMVSDVPFGAFLSGGIDSSAIVGLMVKHSNLPVKTFSVGFAEKAYSELAYSGLVAKHFKTEHHELTITEQDVLDELENLVGFRDAPVAEPSDIPIYLLAKEARRHVKMVLTGEGSDEVLGGYRKHVFERYVGLYQMLPQSLHVLMEPLVMALPYRFRSVKTGMVNLGLRDSHERFARWFGALSHNRRRALTRFKPGDFGPETGPQFEYEKNNTRLRKILFFDQVSWLPDNLLERGDRMSMAASLEARVPFLDYKLVEYVSGLSDDFRVRGLTTKWILRQAMTGFIPHTVLHRPKVGFRVPVNEWFRGPLKDYCYDHLTGRDAKTKDYFHKAKVEQLLREHSSGSQNHEKLIWMLLNLEIWHRLYT